MTGQDGPGLPGWAGLTSQLVRMALPARIPVPVLRLVLGGRTANQEREAFR
jgi:hypothetical protein